jgi:predicted dehydrogenase
MRNGKLQAGVIGVGAIARDQHIPAWARVPFAEVVAVADVAEEALQKTADIASIKHRFKDWQDLVELDELDIVDVCTPNRTHMPIALAALNHGKHVLCEKPLGTTAEEVRILRDAARREHRLVMAAQHLRFDPTCQQLKRLIDSGLLGEIYFTRAQWLRRRMLPPRATFTEKPLSGGGPVMDLGVHMLDLAYWFMGAPEPVTVSAMVDTRLAHRADLTGSWGDWDRTRFDVEDFAAGFVRFATGATLTLEVSWLAFQPEPELIRLQYFGTQGGAVWPEGMVVGETNRVPWNLRLDEVPKKLPHHEQILQFALAVRDDLPSPVPVEESLNVLRMLDGFYLSAQTGREAVLPTAPSPHRENNRFADVDSKALTG